MTWAAAIRGAKSSLLDDPHLSEQFCPFAFKSSWVCCPPNLHNLGMGGESVDVPVAFFQAGMPEMSSDSPSKTAWPMSATDVGVRAGLECNQSKASNRDGPGIFKCDQEHIRARCGFDPGTLHGDGLGFTVVHVCFPARGFPLLGCVCWFHRRGSAM